MKKEYRKPTLQVYNTAPSLPLAGSEKLEFGTGRANNQSPVLGREEIWDEEDYEY